ncbi:hypothetical protein MPL1032_150121 [Mesorhizobium plurifarium]|uniref:Uncharacterized protein n=1 Tax=Mesorhizobium plurifarium TaxID=69974 RepID=A0A0K2VSC7_MESPL|nr:hypothetical protein MPL1032_150121 [Mesorhizobium plurifarium]
MLRKDRGPRRLRLRFGCPGAAGLRGSVRRPNLFLVDLDLLDLDPRCGFRRPGGRLRGDRAAARRRDFPPPIGDNGIGGLRCVCRSGLARNRRRARLSSAPGPDLRQGRRRGRRPDRLVASLGARRRRIGRGKLGLDLRQRHRLAGVGMQFGAKGVSLDIRYGRGGHGSGGRLEILAQLASLGRLLSPGVAVFDDPSDGSQYLFHGRFALRAACRRHRHIRRPSDLSKNGPAR